MVEVGDDVVVVVLVVVVVVVLWSFQQYCACCR